jgi:hypothetical protein
MRMGWQPTSGFQLQIFENKVTPAGEAVKIHEDCGVR